MADKDQSMVYAGEHMVEGMLSEANREGGARTVEIAGTMLTLPVERRFASIDSIQTYVDKVLGLPSVVELYHPGPCRVRERRGNRMAHYCAGVIAIHTASQDRWAAREIVVLHELAHHLTNGDGHGSKFREALIFLTEICMAPEVAFALRVCWVMSGLK